MNQNKKFILIAEDEEDLMEIYSMAFSKTDFVILKAKNGIEVLETLEREFRNVALLILDIIMPEMDGFEVLEKIKADSRFLDIPVFMSTNLDNEDDKQQAYEMGAVKYFVKSMHTPSELAFQVKTFLGGGK